MLDLQSKQRTAHRPPDINNTSLLLPIPEWGWMKSWDLKFQTRKTQFDAVGTNARLGVKWSQIRCEPEACRINRNTLQLTDITVANVGNLISDSLDIHPIKIPWWNQLLSSRQEWYTPDLPLKPECYADPAPLIQKCLIEHRNRIICFSYTCGLHRALLLEAVYTESIKAEIPKFIWNMPEIELGISFLLVPHLVWRQQGFPLLSQVTT